MAFSRSNKHRKTASNFQGIRELISPKGRASRPGQSKSRQLRIDPLEERQMLSLTVADPSDLFVNESLSSSVVDTASTAYSSPPVQSIAVDNDGDMVSVWTRTDPLLHPVTGDPLTDPRTGDVLFDQNVYARYFTDEVQRLTLPEDVLNNTEPSKVSRFALTYGGAEVQKLEIFDATEPYEFFQQPIIGTFQLGFDVNENGIISPLEFTTINYSDITSPEITAGDIERELQGLGGALENVQVSGVSAHEFLIHFGETTSNQDQPEIAVANTGFASGFLPTAMITTVSEPTLITQYDLYGNPLGIPIIPDNPAQTAAYIEMAFWNARKDITYSPVEQSGSISAPPINRVQYPEVDVRAIDGNVFEITFIGTSGKQNHPEFDIPMVEDESERPLTPSLDAVVTLKESSPEFRVDAPDVDDIWTPLPEVTRQYNPAVAMDIDGEFVITWESEVLDSEYYNSQTDIFARRFVPQELLAESDILFYSDGLPASESSGVPVQGVRPLGQEFIVNTGRDEGQMDPSISMDDQGNFAIAWTTLGQDMSYFSTVYLQRFNRDGERVGNMEQVNTDQTQIAFRPNVSMSDDGHMYVSWNETGDPNYLYNGTIAIQSRASLWDPAGTPLITESTAIVAGGYCSATFDAQNNLLVVGEAVVDADAPGASSGARAAMFSLYDATGNFALTPMRPEFAVNGSNLSATGTLDWPEYQGKTSAGIDADGDIVITYSGYGSDTSYLDTSIALPYAILMDGSYFEDYINSNTNSDLLPFFDPSTNVLQGLDVDDAIQNALVVAMRNGANLDVLSRLNGIFESQARDLRNIGNTVMYTRLESDPRLGNSLVLATDATVPTVRDGRNTRAYIILESSVGGGNFTVDLVHEAWDLPVPDQATIAIVAVNNVIDPVLTAASMQTALSGADVTGGLDPVVVTYLNPANVAFYADTPWEIPTSRPSDLVFEVQFQGSTHDRFISMTLDTGALTTPGLDELQSLRFIGNSTGYFTLGALMPQGGNNPPLWTQTSEILFDPLMDPALFVGTIQNQLSVIFPGILVYADSASTQGNIIIYMSFEGASGAVDQPTIARGTVNNPLPPAVPLPTAPGIITQYMQTIEGGPGDAPDPVITTLQYGSGGSEQSDPWMAMEPDGDFVIAWTDYRGDATTGFVGNSIRYRRFDESVDDAGPQVTDFLLASGERLEYGDQVMEDISKLVVTFDEEMLTTSDYSILDPDNWALLKDGVEILGGVSEIDFGMNLASSMAEPMFDEYVGANKWEAILTLDANGNAPGVAVLTEGNYEIVAKDWLRDLAGNTLDASGYAANGNVYTRPFFVFSPGESEILVNTGSPGDQITRDEDDASNPPSPRSTVSDADGDFINVWTVQPDGSGRQGVYAKIYDAEWQEVDGERIVDPLVPVREIHVSNNPSATHASVAVDGDGDFIVVWSELSDQVLDSWDIYARRFDATGTPLDTAPFLVNTETLNSQHFASVDMDIDGDFVIAWQSLDQDGSGLGVYAQRFGPNGVPLGGSDEIQSISFLGDMTGQFTLTYNDDALAPVTTEPITIETSAFNTADDVEQKLREKGILVEAVGVNSTEIYIRFLEDKGNQDVLQMTSSFVSGGTSVSVSTELDGSSGELLVNDTTENNQYHPSVAMSAEGEFVISWTSAGQNLDAAYETNI